jgi:hypothetical protein
MLRTMMAFDSRHDKDSNAIAVALVVVLVGVGVAVAVAVVGAVVGAVVLTVLVENCEWEGGLGRVGYVIT